MPRTDGAHRRGASSGLHRSHGQVTSSLRFVAGDALRAMAQPSGTTLDAAASVPSARAVHTTRQQQRSNSGGVDTTRRHKGEDSMTADVASLSKAFGATAHNVNANASSSGAPVDAKPRATSPYAKPFRHHDAGRRLDGSNPHQSVVHDGGPLSDGLDSRAPMSVRLKVQLHRLWDDVNAPSTEAMRDAIGLHLEALRSLERSSATHSDRDAVAADARLHLFYIEEHISLLTEERKLVVAMREKMLYRSRIIEQLKACAVKYRNTVTQHILLVRQQQQQGRYGAGALSGMLLGHASSSSTATTFSAPRHVGPSASVIISGILHEVHHLLDVYRLSTVEVAELHAQWRRWIASGNFFGCASRDGSSDKWERAVERPSSEAGALPSRGRKHRSALLSRSKEVLRWNGPVPLLVTMSRDLFLTAFEGEPLHVLLGLPMDWNPLALPGRRWSVIGASGSPSLDARPAALGSNRHTPRSGTSQPTAHPHQPRREAAAHQPALVSLFSRFAKDYRWRALLLPTTPTDDDDKGSGGGDVDRTAYLAFFARQHRRLHDVDAAQAQADLALRRSTIVRGGGGAPSSTTAHLHQSTSAYYASVGVPTPAAPSALYRYAEGKAHHPHRSGGGPVASSSDTERLYERCSHAFAEFRSMVEMHSVVRIQALVRGTQTRSALWARLSSVVVLQRTVRGHLGRLCAAQARRDRERMRVLLAYWQARCPSVSLPPGPAALAVLEARCHAVAHAVVSRWLCFVALRQRGRRQRQGLRIALLQRVGRRMLVVRQLRRHALTMRRIRNGLGLVDRQAAAQRAGCLAAERDARCVLRLVGLEEGLGRLEIVRDASRTLTTVQEETVSLARMTAATVTLSKEEANARTAIRNDEEPTARVGVESLAVHSLAMSVLLTQATQHREAMLQETIGALTQLHAHYTSTVVFPQHYVRRLDDEYVARTLTLWDEEAACRLDVDTRHQAAIAAQLAAVEGRMAADLSESAVASALHTPERMPRIVVDVAAQPAAVAPQHPPTPAATTSNGIVGTITPQQALFPTQQSPTCTPRRSVTPTDPNERLGSPSLNFLCRVFPTDAPGGAASLTVMAGLAHEEATGVSSPTSPVRLDATTTDDSPPPRGSTQPLSALAAGGDAVPPREPRPYDNLGPVPPPAAAGPPPKQLQAYDDLGPVPPPAPVVPTAVLAPTTPVVPLQPLAPPVANAQPPPPPMPPSAPTAAEGVAASYDNLPPFARNALRMQAERLQAVGHGWMARRTVAMHRRALSAQHAIAMEEAREWLLVVVEPWCRLVAQSTLRMANAPRRAPNDFGDTPQQQQQGHDAVPALRAPPDAPLQALRDACSTFVSIMRVRAMDAAKRRQRQVRVMALVGVLLPFLRQRRRRGHAAPSAAASGPLDDDGARLEMACIATSMIAALEREEGDTRRWLIATFAASAHVPHFTATATPTAARTDNGATNQTPEEDDATPLAAATALRLPLDDAQQTADDGSTTAINAAGVASNSARTACSAAIATLQRVGRQWAMHRRCAARRRLTMQAEALARFEALERWTHLVLPYQAIAEAIATQHADCLERSSAARRVAAAQRTMCYLAATVIRSGMCNWVRRSWASVCVQQHLRWRQSVQMRHRLAVQAQLEQARIEEGRRGPALATIVRHWRCWVTRRRVARTRALEMQTMRTQHAASVIGHAVRRWIASCSAATRTRRRIAACRAMIPGSPAHDAAVGAAVVRLQCMFRAAAAKRKATAMRDAERLQHHQQIQERASRLIQTLWRRAMESRRLAAALAPPPDASAATSSGAVVAVVPLPAATTGTINDAKEPGAAPAADAPVTTGSADSGPMWNSGEPTHIATATSMERTEGNHQPLLFPAPLRAPSSSTEDDAGRDGVLGPPAAALLVAPPPADAQQRQQVQPRPTTPLTTPLPKPPMPAAAASASVKGGSQSFLVGKLRSSVVRPSATPTSFDGSASDEGMPDAPRDGAPREGGLVPSRNTSISGRGERPSSSSSSVVVGKLKHRVLDKPPPTPSEGVAGQRPHRDHPPSHRSSSSGGSPPLPLAVVQPDDDDLFSMLTAPPGSTQQPQRGLVQQHPPAHPTTGMPAVTSSGAIATAAAVASMPSSADNTEASTQCRREASAESLPSPPPSPPRPVHVAPPQPPPGAAANGDDEDVGGELDWEAVVRHNASTTHQQKGLETATGEASTTEQATGPRDRSLDSFRRWTTDDAALHTSTAPAVGWGGGPPPSPPELDDSLPGSAPESLPDVSDAPSAMLTIARQPPPPQVGRAPSTLVSGTLRPGTLQQTTVTPHSNTTKGRTAASTNAFADRVDFGTLRRVGPSALIGAMVQHAAKNRPSIVPSCNSGGAGYWQDAPAAQPIDVADRQRLLTTAMYRGTHDVSGIGWSRSAGASATTRYDPFQPAPVEYHPPQSATVHTNIFAAHGDDTGSLPDGDGPPMYLEDASLGDVSANSSIGSLPCEVVGVATPGDGNGREVTLYAGSNAALSNSSNYHGAYATTSSASRRSAALGTAAAVDVHYAAPRSLPTNPTTALHHRSALLLPPVAGDAPQQHDGISLDDALARTAADVAVPWQPTAAPSAPPPSAAQAVNDPRTFSPSRYLSTSLPETTSTGADVAVHYGSPLGPSLRQQQSTMSSWTSEQDARGKGLGDTSAIYPQRSTYWPDSGSPPSSRHTQRPTTSAGTPASAMRRGSLLRASPPGDTPRLRMPDITVDPPSSPRPTPQRRIRPDPNRSPTRDDRSPSSGRGGDGNPQLLHAGNPQRHNVFLSPLRRPADMLQSAERHRRLLQERILQSRDETPTAAATPSGAYSYPSQGTNYLTMRPGAGDGGNSSGRRLYNDFE